MLHVSNTFVECWKLAGQLCDSFSCFETGRVCSAECLTVPETFKCSVKK